jgi:RNA recognition motif-containing protein
VAVRLFVGGLASTMSSEGLQQIFAEYGVVEAAHVPTVRDTEKSRPFAFIEMATAEAADAAIRSLDGRMIDGRRIRVERAKSR